MGGATSANLVGAWRSTYSYEEGSDYVEEEYDDDMCIAFYENGTWIASEDEKQDGTFYFCAYDYGTWSVKNGEITMVSSDPVGDYDETFTVKLNGSELTIEENGYCRDNYVINYDDPYYEKTVYEKLSSDPDIFQYYYD